MNPNQLSRRERDMNEKAPGYLDALEGTILKQKEENLLLVERVKELRESLEKSRQFLHEAFQGEANRLMREGLGNLKESKEYTQLKTEIDAALKGDSLKEKE